MPMSYDANALLQLISSLDFGPINIELGRHAPTNVELSHLPLDAIPSIFHLSRALLRSKLRPQLLNYLTDGVDTELLGPQGKVGCLVDSVKDQVVQNMPVDGEVGMTEFMSIGIFGAVNVLLLENSARNTSRDGPRRYRARGTGGSGRPDVEMLIDNARKSVYVEIKPPIIASSAVLDAIPEIIARNAVSFNNDRSVRVNNTMSAVMGLTSADIIPVNFLPKFEPNSPQAPLQSAGIEVSPTVSNSTQPSPTHLAPDVPGTFALFLSLAVLDDTDYVCTGGGTGYSAAQQAAPEQIQSSSGLRSLRSALHVSPRGTLGFLCRSGRSHRNRGASSSSASQSEIRVNLVADTGTMGSSISPLVTRMLVNDIAWKQTRSIMLSKAETSRHRSLINLYERFANGIVLKTTPTRFEILLRDCIGKGHVWHTFKAEIKRFEGDAITYTQKIIVKVSCPDAFSANQEDNWVSAQTIRKYVEREINAFDHLIGHGLDKRGIVPELYGVLKGSNMNGEDIQLIMLEDAGVAVDWETITQEEGHWVRNPITGSIKIIDFDRANLESEVILGFEIGYVEGYIAEALKKQADNSNGMKPNALEES
ncbi:hypothetical protein I204_05330 [Kwoniella mangroviensis CBS 8886]|nr:hypothetical protein I204_05330 [Kwoniella mangroviensis CBS 8886]